MARGKYLSLEEARKAGKLKQFAKEHPSQGDGELFDRLLENMAMVPFVTVSEPPEGFEFRTVGKWKFDDT
ncbi:MAG: hypothetical protein HQ512_13070 [Rhodospirillales bacterium]|nr:hypothetical protein [Rhodospirillales bacterium]